MIPDRHALQNESGSFSDQQRNLCSSEGVGRVSEIPIAALQILITQVSEMNIKDIFRAKEQSIVALKSQQKGNFVQRGMPRSYT